MRFSKKIFISVFLTTLVLGSAVIWAAHAYVRKQTKEEYVSRYSVFSKVMGDALTRLDKNTETLMLNAVKVIAARDEQKGLSSTETLKAMRDELSVTHIFITDKNGNFIRSTNESPNLIPNIFSFCGSYRDLIAGTAEVAATPIIHPQPEPKPYKFLLVPSFDRKRLLEVGVRVDFVAKTLTDAVTADPNLVSMSLHSPAGSSFARFSAKDVEFRNEIVQLPASFPKVVDAGDTFRVFTKVASSQPHCCECDVAGTSKNGEYYYVLESQISKKELIAVQATTEKAFFLLALGNLLSAFFLSRFISRRLVRNIEAAAKKVRAINESGDFDKRISLKGRDEVAYLTREFDRLLDSLEESKRQTVEAEKIQVKVQLAREIAHNIKSPVVAVEMMLPMLNQVPQRIQKVFRDSIKEIKELVERLNRNTDVLNIGDSAQPLAEVQLEELLGDIVQKKRLEYSNSPDVQMEFSSAEGLSSALAKVDPTEFVSVISNLVNNAIESYQPQKKRIVKVFCKSIENAVVIEISDFGRGISPHLISRLGTMALSVGKPGGKGIGLPHTFRALRSWGGRVHILSPKGKGTTVSLFLPRSRSTTGKVGPKAMCAADRANSHERRRTLFDR